MSVSKRAPVGAGRVVQSWGAGWPRRTLLQLRQPVVVLEEGLAAERVREQHLQEEPAEKRQVRHVRALTVRFQTTRRLVPRELESNKNGLKSLNHFLLLFDHQTSSWYHFQSKCPIQINMRDKQSRNSARQLFTLRLWVLGWQRRVNTLLLPARAWTPSDTLMGTSLF